ncbi:MAG: hypothetical protein M1820_009765 [Bogoriella megaspora]|nr:MAG: hypothetical protein M1820_009765 [Bogoriella megaspora]
MGLHSQLPREIEEVDVIIAGGGTTGCIVAGRLAEADPNLSILVIEHGANNFNDPTIIHPGFWLRHIMPDSKTAAVHTAKKSDYLAGREVTVPVGRILGGGSSINFMTYTRGQRSDFNHWKMPGWKADDMLPYLRKLETYHGKGDKDRHGYEGPIHVSRGLIHDTKAGDDFIQAVNKVGWPEIEDLQSLDAVNGAQRILRYISPDGKRQDTAHQYLHPRLQDGKHPNLHVVVESQVVRILVEDKTANGVVFTPNSELHLRERQERLVKARKLVIISCGAMGTPAVLERSGIGEAEILARAGVPLRTDLPGVGNDYEDHQLAIYPYKTNLAPEDTADAVLSGRISAEQLIKDNSPHLGYNAQDVTCKFRPSKGEVAELGPEFQKAWDDHFKEKPDKPLVIMALTNTFPGFDPAVPVGQYLGVTVFSVYPFSRGHVHITGPSPGDPLDFDTGFFADRNAIDLKKHVWAYKKQREIMRRLNTYRGEVASWHPPFPPNSDAVCIETNTPLPHDVRNIVYTAEDDRLIEQFLRERIGTTWHSLGTCKMAPREERGVVDASLGVYGFQKLKIADLSIVPHNVAANTNNTALAVGEKAADIFIEELGLKNQ